MGLLIVILVIVVISFVISFSAMDRIKEENTNKFSQLGYHYIDLLGANYKGGIKNISVHTNAVSISLLKEGLNFDTGIAEKTILFKNIVDMALQSQQYIQNQVSLGKLVVFGVFAFGMERKQNTINDEYILLKVNDEDGEYNVLLQAYEATYNQEIFNRLLMYKNRSLQKSNDFIEI